MYTKKYIKYKATIINLLTYLGEIYYFYKLTHNAIFFHLTAKFN